MTAIMYALVALGMTKSCLASTTPASEVGCDSHTCPDEEFCSPMPGTELGYVCEKAAVCLEENYGLLDQAWRHPDNFVNETDINHDWYHITDGAWYRFLINGTNALIPVGCFGFGYCGTDYGIKFHPRDRAPRREGHQVKTQVCDHYLRFDRCCNFKYTILARRCSSFTVYRLIRPSFGAYCAIQEYIG